MDNGPHEDSSRCDCGDGENGPLLHIWQSQDKDLSTTIDNAWTMGLMRTAQDVTVVMERTAHYFIFGSTGQRSVNYNRQHRDNGPHEDSSRCDCGDGENCPLLHIWQSLDKDLSTTIDKAGTMGLMRTAQDVTVVMERTAHYFIFGSHRTKTCHRQSTTQGQWAS